MGAMRNFAGYAQKRFGRKTRPRVFRRRTYKKRYSRRRVLPFIMPRVYYTKLRYVGEFSINATNNSSAVQDMSCNNLFDPDVTGVGHQPMGFDELCKFYKRFTVLGSKCQMAPTFTTTSNTIPGYYGIGLSEVIGDYSAWGTTEVLEESHNNRPAICGLSNLEAFKRYQTKKWSAKRWFGKKPLDDDYECSAGASPVHQCYYHCWVASINGNDPDAQIFHITVEYIVKCEDLITLSQS